MTADKSLELKLRRTLEKRGLLLRKSRKTTFDYDDQGGYAIIDAYGGYVVAGSRFDMSLEDVEAWLKE